MPCVIVGLSNRAGCRTFHTCPTLAPHLCGAQEAELFTSWLDALKRSREEQERLRMQIEEENVMVGPRLEEAVWAAGGKANYGGALLPGEGDRCVWGRGKCVRGGRV